MSEIEFEWEARKAASNRKKHRVSFEEATRHEHTQYFKKD